MKASDAKILVSKHMTIKEVIDQLKDVSECIGEDTFVYAEDSSGYEYEVTEVNINDYNYVVLG